MEICPDGLVGGSLTVDHGFARCRQARYCELLRSRGSSPWLGQSVLSFRSDHVLLLVPDQAWVMGTVASAGKSASVAVEATVAMDARCTRATLCARILGDWLQGPVERSGRPSRAKTVVTLHLGFVRQ